MERNLCNCLRRLRIIALIILAFSSYYSFSEIEFTLAINFSLPLCYQGLQQLYQPDAYQTKRMFAVFIPLVLNFLLWNRNYVTYIYFRGIISVELFKMVIAVVVSTVRQVIGYLGIALYNPVAESILVYGYFGLLIYLYKITGSLKWRRLFYEEHEENFRKKRIAIIMLAGTYCILIGMVFLEGKFQEEKFSTVNHIEKYYIEGKDENFDYSHIRELFFFHDGKKFANFLSNDGVKNVGIFKTMTGEKIGNINGSGIKYGGFFSLKNSMLIIRVQPVDRNKKKLVIEERNLKSGEKEKAFDGSEEVFNKDVIKNFYVEKAILSDDDQYLLMEGYGVGVWDLKTGELIDFYRGNGIKQPLEWISNEEYIVFTPSQESEVYVGKIKNGKVEKNIKEKMTKDFRGKVENVIYRGRRVLLKKKNKEKVVAIVISGEFQNGLFNPGGYLDIWNVEEENKIFSIKSNYEITNIDFSSDGKFIFVLEKICENKNRISIWNVEEERREKCFYFFDSGKTTDIKFIEEEGRLILLKNPITIIHAM